MALVVAWRQLRLSRALMRSQARPYVIVDFEQDEHFVDLVVKNIGATPALALSLTFDPPLTSSIDQDPFPLSNVGFLRDPVAFMAPGRELRTVFEALIERGDKEGLPDRFDVTLTYNGPPETGGPFEESAVLDLAVSRGSTWIAK